MSESEQSARPRQLTMAGGFVIGGSLILLFTVFDTLTNLHSVDTRDEVAKMLSSQTGSGLGITVSEALSGMRVGLMVAAVCAAASAILGVFVFQRHRGARVALSVLAVPILVTSPLTGGLLGVLVAAATLTLWSGPARDWYAGRPIREPVRRTPEPPRPGPLPPSVVQAPPPAATPPEAPSVSDVSTGQTSAQPTPTSGFGAPPAQQHLPVPPGQWAPPAGASAGWPQPAPSNGVPVPVRVACLLTWAFSGVVALMYVAALFALVLAKDQIVDRVTSSPEWHRVNLEPNMILPVLWLGCLMFLAWSVGAIVLAWFTWRRHNWARYLLAASAGAGLVAALFAFPVGIVHQVACAVTITALFSARSRDWFARPTHQWPPQGPPSGPPPSGTQDPSYGPPPGQQGRPRVW